MNERDVSEAIAAWIGDALEIPEEARYPFFVAAKTGPLSTDQPDVAAVVERKRLILARNALELFPFASLQQHDLVRVFEVGASVMIAVRNSERGALEATRLLQSYGERLELLALEDPTLGERAPMLSPEIDFDYSAVFEEDDAEVRGRIFSVGLVVGEIVDGDSEGFG